MIFIGLDVSKVSTALCIEKGNNIILYNYSTKKDNNIWVKETKDFIIYRHIQHKYGEEKDYSKSEILKLNEFDIITDLIITDIFDNINSNDEVKINIEGYSYRSTGPIFDIIEFTTILKHKLIKMMSEYTLIEIVAPLTLKKKTCKMIYEPRIELKGKRVIKEILHYENNNGKEATKFDKWDMFYAFLESDINMTIKDWCISNYTMITKDNEIGNTKVREVPKPLDDIIDAIFLKEIAKQSWELSD
jgi:hypothetical protein